MATMVVPNVNTKGRRGGAAGQQQRRLLFYLLAIFIYCAGSTLFLSGLLDYHQHGGVDVRNDDRSHGGSEESARKRLDDARAEAKEAARRLRAAEKEVREAEASLRDAEQRPDGAGEAPAAKQAHGNTRHESDDKWWLGRMKAPGWWNEALLMRHPFMGARHPNGTVGMLVDPSPDRLRAVDVTTVSDAVCASVRGNTTAANGFRYGIEGSGGRQALKKAKTTNDDDSNHVGRRSRILCLVYTVHLPSNGRNDERITNHANLRAIARSWGKQCDGFIGGSNVTDHSIGAVDLVHAGPEEYGNMWQKVRSMWAYALQYESDYDFFHIMGDDGYLYVDNFRNYLDGPEVQRLENGHLDSVSSHPLFADHSKRWTNVHPRPLVLGLPVYRRQRGKYPNGTFDGTMIHSTYPAGGPGYTLNRAALRLLDRRRLLEEMFDDLVDSREDVLVGRMFSSVGVYVSVTIDRHHGGRYIGSGENIYRFENKGKSPAESKRMKKMFKMWHGGGLDGMSENAISFHLKDDNPWLTCTNNTLSNLMLRYHAILHDLCPGLVPAEGRTAQCLDRSVSHRDKLYRPGYLKGLDLGKLNCCI